jgi:hypothetical protein
MERHGENVLLCAGRHRVTPSPPRSERDSRATHVRGAGEREGVRGPMFLKASNPLTPSLSPASPK